MKNHEEGLSTWDILSMSDPNEEGDNSENSDDQSQQVHCKVSVLEDQCLLVLRKNNESNVDDNLEDEEDLKSHVDSRQG